MAIRDREDRAASTSRLRAKRVAVRRKKPLPAPDMLATMLVPHTKLPTPKPGRRSVVEKPQPRPRHLPTPIEKQSMLDVMLPPEKGSKRERQIKQYNQDAERQRRREAAAVRAAEAARRKQVRALNKTAREFLGRDKLDEFIKTGAIGDSPGLFDYIKSVGAASVKAAEGAVEDFTTRLSGGLQGREHSDIEPEDSAPVRVTGDLLLGPNLVKAISGKPYNKGWAIGEMALLAVPVKGLPTPLTVLLRGTIGARRYAVAADKGFTVADAIKSMTVPLREIERGRRLALVERAAAKGIEGPIASSLPAKVGAAAIEKVVPGRVGRAAARVVRNDIRAVRKMKIGGGAEIEIAADLSRLGKGGRAVMDAVRDSRLVPLRSQETLGMRQLDKQMRQHLNRAADLEYKLSAALPSTFKKMNWPEMYAARAVLKGSTIDEMIQTTAANVERAKAEGNWLSEQANRAHLAMFQKAAKYVTTDAEGNPVFAADAPRRLHLLTEAVQETSGRRESILKGVERLTDEVAQGRILNEQLHYAGARAMPRDDWFVQQLGDHPVRQQLEEVLSGIDAQNADAGLAFADAWARRVYTERAADLDARIKETEGWLARHPGGPLNARHQATLDELRAAREALTPADLYDEITSVADVLPQDIVEKINAKYGAEHGKDWRFSLHDADDTKAAAKRITDEIVASDIALPPEWSDPAKIQAGIEEVFRLARDGEFGKDWYPEAAEGVVRVAKATRVDPRVVAQLFAIYSQAADTVANSTFVFKAIRQYQKHKDLFVGRFPTRQSEEALKVLQGGTWEGRKRSSFYANILRHIPGQEDEYARVIAEMAEARKAPINHPVTVDRWVVRMFNALGTTKAGKPKDVPGRYYDAFETVIQRMAESIGWEPEQLQAAAWVAKKGEGIADEIAAAGGKVTGPLKARFDAGAGDAFQAGIERNLAKLDEPISAVPPQAERLANQANKKWGGFTVDRDLQPVPEVGYSVSYSLTDTPFALHKLKGADIVEFRDRYATLLKDTRNKIGGFSDDANDFGDGTEITSLSINRHFKRKADALRFAREQGQETVYEYKTGDGIRTGLTRDEQRAIIEGLDDAHLKGAPRSNYLPPSEHEMEMKKFLDEAARELGIAKKKVVTGPQRVKAEDWLARHAAEFPDEDLVKRYWDLNASTPEGDLPAWALEPAPSEVQAVRDSAPMRESLFDADGKPVEGFDLIAGSEGEKLAAEFDQEAYAQAISDLQSGILPRDFIEAIANSPLHIYDKFKIGFHLNRVAGDDALKNMEWDTDALRRMFPKDLTLAGLWEAETKRLYFSKTSHPIDWVHEWTHAMETAGAFPPGVKDDLWRAVGAEPGAKLTHDQSEDLADHVTSRVLGWEEEGSKLPESAQRALGKIRDEVRAAMKTGDRTFWRENKALAAIPEGERNFLEDILFFEAEEGRHFTDGFKPRPGTYVPERPGLPFRFGNPLAPRRTSTLWYRMLAGKRIATLTETDKHLERSFQGILIDSGYWDKDVTKGPLEGLLKAYQIQRMDEFRKTMIKAGVDRPTPGTDAGDWIMIPIDAKKWSDKTRSEARNVIDILNAMDAGASIDKQALSKVDAAAIEQVKEFMFPGLADGQAHRAEVKRLAAQAMDHTQKPIEGVVWVDRSMLDKMSVFQKPVAPDSKVLRYGLGAADTLNNIMKMMTLSLNPAYYPMNMAGQGIMLGAQLGFSAPFSLARSLRLMKQMSPEDLALVDRFSGVGFAGAQMLSKGGIGKKTTDAVGKVGTFLIDKYPRRVSFLHEARRLGYNTPEKIRALTHDLDHFDDLMKVHDRVGRAMVDYGNLNRFEKEAMTRLVFVYPWLRGSSRYTAQFPFDHPVQAALFAGLVYWQQNRLRESLPEGHPGYLKWYLPIEQAEGENPFGFRMDQLMTPLQTLDIAALVTYWGSGGKVELPWGSNEEGMASMLGPLAEEIEKTVSGWDSFTRREVSHGLPDLLFRILDPRERWASWRRLKNIIDHRTHTGIYDTTQTQNWLRLFLGSLAPMDIDVEKAGEMAAVRRGNPSAEQSRDDYLAKVERAYGKPLTDAQREQIGSWKAADQVYRRVSREYRREHDLEGESSYQARVAMLLLTLAELRPEVADKAKAKAEAARGLDDASAREVYDALRDTLGLSKLGTLDGRLQKRLGEASEEGS